MMLRDDLSNAEIGERLGVSVETVKHHVSEILSKLNVSTRREAAQSASERGGWSLALMKWLFAGSAAVVLVGVAVLVWGVIRNGDGSENPDEVGRPDQSGRLFQVEGASMQPTLEDGDIVTIHSYGDALPERGDIIVFNPPTAIEREFIKRVIALPGDIVAIDEREGVVMVNGVRLDESYVTNPTRCRGACTAEVPESALTSLPQFSPLGGFDATCQNTACYYVMGDNRPISSDSRLGYLVPAENIVGWVAEP